MNFQDSGLVLIVVSLVLLGAGRDDDSLQAAEFARDVSRPRIETTIAAVHPNGSVVLACGREGGVVRGMRFTVRSGGSYKATVTVEDVFEVMARARIDAALMVQMPAEGDSATLRGR